MTLAIGLVGTILAPDPPAAASGGTPASREPDDLRTLPVRYDGCGARGRSFRGAAQILSESDQDDWAVKGPRSMLWVVRNMAGQGQTPRQRHYVLAAAGARLAGGRHGRGRPFLFLGDHGGGGLLRPDQRFRADVHGAHREALPDVGAVVRFCAPQGRSRLLGEIFLGNERSRGHAFICPESSRSGSRPAWPRRARC